MRVLQSKPYIGGPRVGYVPAPRLYSMDQTRAYARQVDAPINGLRADAAKWYGNYLADLATGDATDKQKAIKNDVADFAESYKKFDDDWVVLKQDIDDAWAVPGGDDPRPSKWWTQIGEFETDYRKRLAQWTKLTGLEPSVPPPPTKDEWDKEHPAAPPFFGNGPGSAIDLSGFGGIVKGVAVVAVILVGLYALSTAKSFMPKAA